MNQEGKRKEKQDRLLDAMGQIDDSFVEAAQKAGRRKTARPGLLSFGAVRVLAACAALAVCVVLYRFAAIKQAAPVQEQEAPVQGQEEPVREAVPEGRSARSVGEEAAEPAPASLEENAAEDIDGQAAALTQEKAEGVLGVVLEADGGRVTFRIVNGTLRKGDKVKFFHTGKEYDAEEVGVLGYKQIPCDSISAGTVGYIISGIKTSVEVKVGDTITHVERPCEKAIEGFENVKPMVFAGVYPVTPDDYEDLRASIEKLQLNDASLTYEPESSIALGFGFRCGFLGLLHMEIIQERLEREFNMDVITTVPNVSYKVTTTKGEVLEIHNPSGLAF